MAAKKKDEKLAKRYHLEEYDEDMRKAILKQLKRRRRTRRLVGSLCALVAVVCLGYFGGYYYLTKKSGNDFQQLEELKQKKPVGKPFWVNKTGEGEKPEMLEEYINLYNKNKSLIGWIRIEDTPVDYPVMQSSNSEYYLDHNFNQEYDKNGCIFMDPACDVLRPSANLILYGHHMKSGSMFGVLSQYEKESFYREHKEIQFDTIYEKGVYAVMYVFRDRIHQEDEIRFKYYQFYDANSPEEFNSNMKEMKEMSVYDTGVTASYGDRLLTLSTCDYEEENGRFVVVAKKIG